jgi:uncharacterized membrane protein
MIIALSVLLLVIGCLRTLAVVFSPEKYLEQEVIQHG